jgi:hypothetical protein
VFKERNSVGVNWIYQDVKEAILFIALNAINLFNLKRFVYLVKVDDDENDCAHFYSC